MALLVILFCRDAPGAFPSPDDFRAIFRWSGELILKFAPWPAVIIALFLLSPSRELLRALGRRVAKLADAALELSQSASEVNLGNIVRITRQKAEGDPQQVLKILNKQVEIVERSGETDRNLGFHQRNRATGRAGTAVLRRAPAAADAPPLFIIFIDAKPANYFSTEQSASDQVGHEAVFQSLFDDLYSGVERTGLDQALEGVWRIAESYGTLLDEGHGPR